MSWPKRLKKAASFVSTATFASAGISPSVSKTRLACGRILMPTPTALMCGADSNTRQAMPRRCSSSASVSPPMPPPMMRTSCTCLVYGEVRLLQRTGGGDFARRARGDDAPALDDVRAVGEREREARHLVDQQDRGRLGAQAVEGGEEIVDHRRREAERGLVQEQQLGPRH